MQRRGIQTAGVLQLWLSIPAVSTSDWFIVNLPFSPSLHLGPCRQDSWLIPSAPPEYPSVWRAEISPLFSGRGLTSLRLHCPRLTSSCTLWLCRVLFHTTGPPFNRFAQGTVFHSCALWMCKCPQSSSWTSIFWHQRDFSGEPTGQSDKARGSDKTLFSSQRGFDFHCSGHQMFVFSLRETLTMMQVHRKMSGVSCGAVTRRWTGILFAALSAL